MKVWLLVLHEGSYSDYSCSRLGIYERAESAKTAAEHYAHDAFVRLHERWALDQGRRPEWWPSLKPEPHEAFLIWEKTNDAETEEYTARGQGEAVYYEATEYEVQP